LRVGRFSGSYGVDLPPSKINSAKVVSREIGDGLCSFRAAHSRAAFGEKLGAACAVPAADFFGGIQLLRFQQVEGCPFGKVQHLTNGGGAPN
jgi:hypothetical protein